MQNNKETSSHRAADTLVWKQVLVPRSFNSLSSKGKELKNHSHDAEDRGPAYGSKPDFLHYFTAQFNTEKEAKNKQTWLLSNIHAGPAWQQRSEPNWRNLMLGISEYNHDDPK